MHIRNENFTTAINYLKCHGIIKTQKELAGIMGVSEDTITRIRKGKRVTEDVISKLQVATDCIFNIQWLRGESDIMLAEQTCSKDIQNHMNLHSPTPRAVYSCWINAIITNKDDVIAALKREVSAKDETIATLHDQLSDKNTLIQSLQQQVAQAQQLADYFHHALALD